MLSSNYQTYSQRLKYLDGIDAFIAEKMADKQVRVYFANFMFSQIPGSVERKIATMHADVSRFHGLLTRHVVRKPESDNWKHLKPTLIGAPDLPVHKRGKKIPLNDFKVNGGIHFNALIVAPRPRNTAAGVKETRQSRLEVGLEWHVMANSEEYETEYLDRIYLKRLRYGTMADYTFKAFKNGHFDVDNILVL